jgi:periplasmic divalent cation tolerance protein
MTDYVQVTTATETRDGALQLARSVTAARLAAGAQIIGPVASIVWHLGVLIEGEEWQLVLKTRADRSEQLAAYLVEHHPWDNPEVSVTRFVAGSQAYMKWLDSMTTPEA